MEKTQLHGKGLEVNEGVPEMMVEKTGGADRGWDGYDNMLDLLLLHNPFLPPTVLPTTYDWAMFEGTILYPKALRNTLRCIFGDVCHVCLKMLQAGKLPKNALANF